MSRMIFGYAGMILRVDLTDGQVWREELDSQLIRRFLGGEGIASTILYREVGGWTDPLGPENRLIIMTGAFVSTGLPCGIKSTVVSRSPLTGIYGQAMFSAPLGVELKNAGYDGMVVQGRAAEPTYLWIRDGEVQFKDARHLWGRETFTTVDEIRRDLGDARASVITIGPAGERLVRLASIVADDSRVAGRCGLGAVMGSKNLKAIACRGNGRVRVKDPERLNQIGRDAVKLALPNTKAFRENGTASGLIVFEQNGNLPIRNWTRGSFPGAEEITGATMTRRILKSSYSCRTCPIACGRKVRVEAGPYAMEGSGPEYETMAALGSLCFNSNLESIAKANDVCNRLGIDTISTGQTIAFAMECYERGLLKDTGGIDLSWGNPDAVVKLCELVGKREGLGSLLGEGVRRAAETIGSGAERFAIHVKGLEFPEHNPRKFKSMGVAYATSNVGANHNRGSPMLVERNLLSPELPWKEPVDGFLTTDKGRMTKVYQDLCCAVDSLGICKFMLFWGRLPLTMLLDFYQAITGWDLSLEDLMRAGERIWNLQRAFNIRMGISRKDDTLPERFLKESVQEGPAKGQVVEIDTMLEEYYRERGLDADGRPGREKLYELGLDWIAEDLQ
ncbi:aldehyde ferredoxin oxidoreductase family protein [Candidatus Bathyarchaeota archaeon]|nr:aldehyde ferredoxin oxidoreductase family protein [Candidatus Bathyarchaeota archaeon]